MNLEPMPDHEVDQLQAQMRVASTPEIAAVIGCLRGMAEAFDEHHRETTFTGTDVATMLRASADVYARIRPEATSA